jgi:hypothetical protein
LHDVSLSHLKCSRDSLGLLTNDSQSITFNSNERLLSVRQHDH